MAHLRRHVDDRAGLLGFDQLARHRLRHEIGGADVEPEDEVEVLNLHVDERRRLVGAGVIDENIERCLRGDCSLHGFDIAHVEHQRLGLVAARADGLSRFLDLGGGACRERHMRAGFGQCGRRREPDAAPGAGHQRAPPVETEGGRFGEVDAHSAACA
jgi:hypothetical protein